MPSRLVVMAPSSFDSLALPGKCTPEIAIDDRQSLAGGAVAPKPFERRFRQRFAHHPDMNLRRVRLALLMEGIGCGKRLPIGARPDKNVDVPAKRLGKGLLKRHFEVPSGRLSGLKHQIACCDQRPRRLIAEPFRHLLEVSHDDPAAGPENDAVKQGDVAVHHSPCQARQKSAAPAGSRASTRSSFASSMLRRKAPATSAMALSGEIL